MPYPQGNPARPSPLLSASLDLISASDVEFGEDGDHIVAFRVPADAWCVWTEKVVMEAFAEGVERATAVPVDADRPPGTSGSWGEA